MKTFRHTSAKKAGDYFIHEPIFHTRSLSIASSRRCVSRLQLTIPLLTLAQRQHCMHHLLRYFAGPVCYGPIIS